MKFKYLLNESDSLRNTFLKSLVDKLEKTYGKSDTRFFGKADCDRLIKRDTDEEITISNITNFDEVMKIADDFVKKHDVGIDSGKNRTILFFLDKNQELTLWRK